MQIYINKHTYNQTVNFLHYATGAAIQDYLLVLSPHKKHVYFYFPHQHQEGGALISSFRFSEKTETFKPLFSTLK